ncbi:MAG: DNA topoisomerase IV subunit B [Magnetococcus sp. WYHC-3]
MSYDASHIKVLEGLEGVRQRPGMYIGGTDSRALHHLVAEVLDNAMDEVIGGFADRIRLTLRTDGAVEVHDNGRGIPIDPHPRFPDKSALEVVMTMLHAGGKFDNRAYATAGGLHGVGVSVVTALSSWVEVMVERDGRSVRQRFQQGRTASPLEELGESRRRGTRVTFLPDPGIFPDPHFSPERLVDMARSRAYLNRGVSVRVRLEADGSEQVFHFPGGLRDYVARAAENQGLVIPDYFSGETRDQGEDGRSRLEWALAWTAADDAHIKTYCNTIPTPAGGTHEAGFRAALLRGFREYAESRNLLPKNITLTIDDILGGLVAVISVFIPNPEFSGQTKDRLNNPEVARLVETILKDHLDHWLHGHPEQASQLAGAIIARAQERIRRKQDDTKVKRKTATSRLTLPGKLTDCSASDLAETELFLVEGDSAGGSAKQARNRETQAILPLRGKILNVEQAALDKFEKNTEIQSLITAIGAGHGRQFSLDRVRYGKIIIMTDADVDGAHIASLLLTFFYRQMPALVRGGKLFLAQPPLYRVTVGARSVYALDDREKERVIAEMTRGRRSQSTVEVSRFKGLGEMDPAQLRETTMSPASRRLVQVRIDDNEHTDGVFNRLMGKRPAERFAFIQERAHFVRDQLDL